MHDGDDALEGATRRLSAALDALEAAILRRRTLDGTLVAMKNETQALANDRVRLAESLDQAHARGVALEAATRQVAARLDSAMAAIRGVIDGHGETGRGA